MFDNPNEIDSITYQMRMADWIRSQNRADINRLFNGVPPYSDKEVDENQIDVNVNFLEGLSLAHDARSQYAQAYMKPGKFFTSNTDLGPVYNRSKVSRIVTKEVSRVMKRSLPYFECQRSKFASLILHGIGPSASRDRERWCPQMIGIDDVFMPANTLLTLENVPLMALYKSYTGPELIRLAKGPHADSAWNQPLVDGCLKWIRENTPVLLSNNWPELWSPEKAQERLKGDGSFYSGDAVPVINCWDFYFWDDSKKDAGWKRRMIIDSWSSPEGANGIMTRRKGKVFDNARQKFLYNPKDRIYARSINEIINFQFADLSAVAPFKYHTVRSLGFLMYAICHLQNRMRCKFSEAVLEALMQYFRVRGGDDVERVLKTELVNKGFIDDGIEFVKREERWNVDANLAELGMRENAQIINKNSSSYTNNAANSTNRPERTKFEVMSEIQSITSLISAGLQQSYAYQVFEYREIFRRFMIKDSRDPEVRSFQAACLRQGVGMEYFNADCWEIEPEKVIGAGNKTLALAIAQQLMEWRPLMDPEPQRIVLRDALSEVMDDSARAEMLVPEQPHISDSVHDAQLAMGSLMMGLPVSVKSGINHIDYIEALMTDMAVVVKQIRKTDNMGTPDKLIGLNNAANHVQQHIQMLAEDKEQKARVKHYSDQLAKMMNLVKGFEQRLTEKMQKQNGNGQPDPEAQAKIQSMLMQAKAKSDNTRDAHAQRTAQRQVQFEMQQDQKRKEFEQKLKQEAMQFQVEMKGEHATKRLDLHVAARTNEQELAANEEFNKQELEHAKRKSEMETGQPE
jgi:hypothetical protein